MKFFLKRRDFTDLVVQPALDFEVGPYSHSTIGGPKLATIDASGSREALFELANHMRAPVEIWSDAGERVWWGYLAGVTINWETITFGVNVDQMSNKVAVAYNDQNVRFTTDWSEDEDSSGEYGIKEKLMSLAKGTKSDALQLRDTYLAGAKYPIPTLSFGGGQSGTAKLTCRGWLDTLDWRYYKNVTGKESYETTGQGGREIGEDDRPKLAMSFQIESDTAWTASSIWLRIWAYSSLPADNLIITLKADNAGAPGADLASSLIAGGDMPTKAEWIEFELNTPVELQPGTQYWISAARSGAINTSQFYMLDTNTDLGYPRGEMWLWYTAFGEWRANVGKGDLLFKIVGNVETTDQIVTLVTACGEFLTGTIIEDQSGIDSNPYRFGDTPALYELQKLLAVGTSNSRRLLCEVAPNRALRVYEEAAKPSSPFDCIALDAKGDLLLKNTRIDPATCPVGFWCHLRNVIPASVDLSVIADPSLFFVDEAEYNPKSGRYRVLRTRNQAGAYDIGGVRQG